MLKKTKSMDSMFYQSDVVYNERNIPNIFIESEFNQPDSVLFPSSITTKNIPNIFINEGVQDVSLCTFNCTNTLYDYPNLFALHESNSEPYGFKSNTWEIYSNYYTNIFSLSDKQHIDCAQFLEIDNSNSTKQENNTIISNESSIKDDLIGVNKLKVKDKSETEKFSTPEKNSIDKSSALCFWYIVTAANVCERNIKPCFPQREISEICIIKDIKLMLLDLGTTYFLVDEETQFYKHNGNISITGLTPEMFESATESILECSNLNKLLRSTINKWKKICDDSIVKALIYAVSNILDDYERTIYSVLDESIMSLVDRLSLINPRLLLLAKICDLKLHSCNAAPDHIPCGIELLNRVHGYLFNYRFPRDSYLKMLLYIFESCCLTYFRILSNWALEGVLNDKETALFVQSKSDLEDVNINRQNSWNKFIVNERIKVPVFLDKYKIEILHCGKTINFFKKFNDLNVFLPDLTCCFDAVDTQRVYEQFNTYFRYNNGVKTTNCVKKMSNCYLFESFIEPTYQKYNTECNVSQDEKLCNDVETDINLNNENYCFFPLPDWSSINDTYDFNKPYGFFIDNNISLMYNGKPFDVINMIDYIPHSLLIPARIQKDVCDKQILNLFFVQENLMGQLYFLSQCFFLMNRQFSYKLCDSLFDGLITNRQKPFNIFNPFTLKSIMNEAIFDSFPGSELYDLKLDVSFIPHLKGIVNILDIECIELNYSPKWPMNMILSNKILLKYRRMFRFAIKLEYVSWSLFKASELLSSYKNDSGLQLRKINLFKHCMVQFVSSIKQYYKQVVVSNCWSELNEKFENVQNYDDLYVNHKQYMHQMFRQCFMVVGLKDKLSLLNRIYIEILGYYQALASGQFYKKGDELLHSEFISIERCFSHFVDLRETFYSSVLQAVHTNTKHYVVQFESLINILGPSYSSA